MKFYRYILAAVLASTFVFNAHAGDWSKVRIGVEGAYPPFSEMTPDGELIGFDIDIANALCEAIGAECELVPQDWDGIIPALLAKKYDAIVASMSITEERKEKVAFTNKYYLTPAKFAKPKSMEVEVTAEGLAGKTVGVQRATTHDNFITEEFPDAEIRRYATQDEAYLDAVSGRVDLLLADSVAMQDGFLKTDQGADWEFVGPGFTDPKYFGDGAGIAVRKDDTDLVELLNKAIDDIRASGKYDEIASKYFEFDVYGG